jgi:hypothetical protein
MTDENPTKRMTENGQIKMADKKIIIKDRHIIRTEERSTQSPTKKGQHRKIGIPTKND